jgi:hypothetical protein
MNILSLWANSLVGPARVKRARRGMEKNWNRFGDSQRRFWGGHYDKWRWLKYRRNKFQDNEKLHL